MHEDDLYFVLYQQCLSDLNDTKSELEICKRHNRNLQKTILFLAQDSISIRKFKEIFSGMQKHISHEINKSISNKNINFKLSDLITLRKIFNESENVCEKTEIIEIIDRIIKTYCTNDKKFIELCVHINDHINNNIYINKIYELERSLRTSI